MATAGSDEAFLRYFETYRRAPRNDI